MNIYSTKFMNEASATLSSKVFKRQANETYLFTTLNVLREMNNVINENTKKMYVQIAEAESKEEENKIFANYFYQFKNIFQDFANKVQEMKSRMIMSIENKVETWDDLIKDDNYITSFEKEFTYSGYQFFHITESDYPRLNLNKVYQKEFDYIAQIMQDTNEIGMSSISKLKIIASVSNNFTNASGDKNWIMDLIKSMVDVDDKETCNSYSECIYNSLRDKYDITVNKGVLYSCKESLVDYEDIIDAATKLCDHLLYDLDKVANNIASYLFRNEDKKLKIKTDTDGIIDRDYRLDTYSMNQLDLFLKNKINQIKKVLNVYSVAIGIKFDTAVDYITQNIDILKTAKECSNSAPCDDTEDNSDEVDDNADDLDDNSSDDIDNVDNSDNEDEPDDDEEDKDDDDEDEEDDSSDDSQDDLPDNDDTADKDAINEEPIDGDTSNDSSKLNDENQEYDDNFDIDERETDNFDEAYLFESELFELEMMQETASMHKFIIESVMHEDETSNNDNKADNASTTNNDSNQDNQNDKLANVKKLADQSNMWQNIVQKLINLWKKFKEAVLVRSESRVKYLNDNKKYLQNGVLKDDAITGSDGSGKLQLKYTPDFNILKKIVIPDLNYESMKQYLVDDKTFVQQYFRDFSDNEKSVSDMIKTKVLGEPQTDKTSFNSIVPSIAEAYDFCSKYPANSNEIQRQTQTIEKAQRVAKDISKVTESASANGFDQYFNEMEQTGSPEAKKTDGGADKSKGVTLYFRVCSQVLAAEMTVYQKLFDELYSFCRWYIRKAGGADNTADKKQEENNDNNKA